MFSSLDVGYETPLNTWVQRDDHRDLAVRLATTSRLSSAGNFNKYDSMYPRSTGQRTSIAVHARSEVLSTNASENVPALTHGSTNTSSVDSADTGNASDLTAKSLLESVDGVLQLAVTAHLDADLICPFQDLECEERFHDIREWKTHIFSHFRRHPCPVTADCFLCERTFSQSRNDHPARAWNEMLSHMAVEHFRRLGQGLETMRTNFALMRWMFSRRIITDAQLTRMQTMPRQTVYSESIGELVNVPEAPMAPSSTSTSSGSGGHDEVFTVHASRRRERMQRRRP